MIPLPTVDGGFRLVHADPPWTFKVRSAKGEGRSACRHYAVMNLDAIKALDVPSIAAKDCHLFLWTTGPHLPEALEVMKTWRFRYSGIAFTSIKLRRNADLAELIVLERIEDYLALGQGYATRKNSELCLLGRRGNPRRLRKDIREVIIAPRREHSRKPDEAYRRIVKYAGECSRVDLFARESHDGFIPWGDESHEIHELRPSDLDSGRPH